MDLTGKYGGRGGYARHLLHLAAYRAGLLTPYERPQLSHVGRVVFVCRGNICRSPYAELVGRASGLNCTSVGLSALEGREAQRGAIEAAMRRGRDLSRHRARPLIPEQVDEGDLFLTMEPGQAKILNTLAHGRSVRVSLLGLWCSSPRPYIQDPYGRPASWFDTCFALLEEAVTHLAEAMRASRRDRRLASERLSSCSEAHKGGLAGATRQPAPRI